MERKETQQDEAWVYLFIGCFFFIHIIGHENVLLSNVIIAQVAVGLLRDEESRRGNKLRIHRKIKREIRNRKREYGINEYMKTTNKGIYHTQG